MIKSGLSLQSSFNLARTSFECNLSSLSKNTKYFPWAIFIPAFLADDNPPFFSQHI